MSDNGFEHRKCPLGAQVCEGAKRRQVHLVVIEHLKGDVHRRVGLHVRQRPEQVGAVSPVPRVSDEVHDIIEMLIPRERREGVGDAVFEPALAPDLLARPFVAVEFRRPQPPELLDEQSGRELAEPAVGERDGDGCLQLRAVGLVEPLQEDGRDRLDRGGIGYAPARPVLQVIDLEASAAKFLNQRFGLGVEVLLRFEMEPSGAPRSLLVRAHSQRTVPLGPR